MDRMEELEAEQRTLLQTIASHRHDLERVHAEQGRPRPLFDPTLRRSIRSVVFVLDISGSMHGTLPFVLVELQRTLQRLPERSKFNIVAFNSHVFRWSPLSLPKDSDSVRSASIWLQGLLPFGSTNTLAAVQEAYQCAEGEGVVWMLSDGRPDQPPAAVLPQVKALYAQHNVPVHTISFNCDDGMANQFLENLAKATQGSFRLFSADDIVAAQQPLFTAADEERIQAEVNRCLARYDECEELIERLRETGLSDLDESASPTHNRPFSHHNSHSMVPIVEEDSASEVTAAAGLDEPHNPQVLEGMRIITRANGGLFYAGTVLQHAHDDCFLVEQDGTQDVQTVSLRDFVPLQQETEGPLHAGDYVVVHLTEDVAPLVPAVIVSAIASPAEAVAWNAEGGVDAAAEEFYKAHIFSSETLVVRRGQLFPVPFWFLAHVFDAANDSVEEIPANTIDDFSAEEVQDGDETQADQDRVFWKSSIPAETRGKQRRAVSGTRTRADRDAKKAALAVEVAKTQREHLILADTERRRKLDPQRREQRVRREAERQRQLQAHDDRIEAARQRRAATLEAKQVEAAERQGRTVSKQQNFMSSSRREQILRREQMAAKQREMIDRTERKIAAKAKREAARRQEKEADAQALAYEHAMKHDVKRTKKILQIEQLHEDRDFADEAQQRADANRRAVEQLRRDRLEQRFEERTKRNENRIQARQDRVAKQQSDAKERQRDNHEETQRKLQVQRRVTGTKLAQREAEAEQAREEEARLRNAKLQAHKARLEREQAREQAKQDLKQLRFENKQQAHHSIRAAQETRQETHEAKQERKAQARRTAQMERDATLQRRREQEDAKRQRLLDAKRSKAEGRTSTLAWGDDGQGEAEARADRARRAARMRLDNHVTKLSRSADDHINGQKEHESYKFRNATHNRFAHNDPNRSTFVLS